MSLLYELVEDDDIRTFRCRLTSDSVPISARLILTRGDVRVEREMTKVVDLWTYRFTDADFTELTAGTWRGQVYTEFADGTNGTYPTRGFIQVRIYKRF